MIQPVFGRLLRAIRNARYRAAILGKSPIRCYVGRSNLPFSC
jgi:hypothetical protein